MAAPHTRTDHTACSSTSARRKPLVLPAGLDPVTADLIHLVNHPDYPAWAARVRRIGGCARPVRLHGATRTLDAASGEVIAEFSSRDEPFGVLLIACRDRRATRCPTCSRVYKADTYHLVRAGLAGGKGVPPAVATHPPPVRHLHRTVVRCRPHPSRRHGRAGAALPPPPQRPMRARAAHLLSGPARGR